MDHIQLKKTARITAIIYLAMAISGLVGFMIFHPQIYIADDPLKTLDNLINNEAHAKLRLLFEFAIIVTQALTAVWFYKLFKNINDGAAWAIGIWGTINSVAIMISAISMASAIEIANSIMMSQEDKVVVIELLGNVIANAWGVGSLFFGLWLIPMGYVITSSNRMPIWLGRTLIFGGACYIVSAIIKYWGIEGPWSDILIIPATIGEFWIIGYMLSFGIRAEKEN